MASKRYEELQKTRKEREEATVASLTDAHLTPKQREQTNHFAKGQVNSTGYFSQPNVKQFQHEMATHCFGTNVEKKKSRGTFFDTVEELDECIVEYLDLCMRTEVVPTISALACWLRCNKDTIYAHASNPNSIFSESCQSIIDFCHMSLENGASESKINSVAYIFQAKNYFGMKDTQEVRVQATTQTLDNASTLQALKEQRDKETSGLLDMRDAEYEEIKPKEEVAPAIVNLKA